LKLQQLIRPTRVFLDADGTDAGSALASISVKIEDDIGVPARKITAALVEREKLGSTSVGDGFAIPHCKLSDLTDVFVALARFAQAVEFGAADGAGVEFVFVVLSPVEQPAIHLQVLSQIARVLSPAPSRPGRGRCRRHRPGRSR